jgi:hypothetical protein
MIAILLVVLFHILPEGEIYHVAGIASVFGFVVKAISGAISE